MVNIRKNQLRSRTFRSYFAIVKNVENILILFQVFKNSPPSAARGDFKGKSDK